MVLLLGVVLLRPLISETYDTAGSAMTRALGPIADASPRTTLIFDALILLSAAICFVARVWERLPYRRTGLEWGTLLLGLAALISTACAGQKRLAFNAAIDGLCGPIVAMALVQLLHGNRLRRVVVAVVLAGACAQAAQCLEQATAGHEETWRHYGAIREDFWRRQGVELDSPTVELFERRMQAREAQGFLPHSNVTGAYLVLCALAGAGVVVNRWRGRRTGADALRAAGGAIGVGVLLVALWTTGSLGAMLSAAAGAALWIVLLRGRVWITEHRRAALAIGWSVALAGAAAFIAHGLVRDEYPHMSLTFRWQYWKTTAPMIADHPWTGVGRENFGRHYLAYKPIDAPEEISNPHNLFVQTWAEYGVVGLAGVVLMLVGATRRFVRPRANVEEPANGRFSRETIWGIGVLILTLIGIRPLLLGTDDPNYLYYATTVTLLSALLGLALFAPSPAALPGASALDTALPAALFTMVLHDQISFALFVPGSATTFFALLACALANRETEEPPAPSRRGPLIGAGAAAGLLAVTILLGLLPVSRGQAWRARVSDLARGTADAPDDPLRADPFDPNLPRHAAEVHLARAAGSPDPRSELQAARAWLLHAVRRDPHQPALHRMLARTGLNQAAVTNDADEARAAVDHARRALELYPQDPDGLIFLAEVEEQAMRLDPSLRDAATTHYRQALELDERRAWFERIRRFSDRKRADIQERMERLRAGGGWDRE